MIRGIPLELGSVARAGAAVTPRTPAPAASTGKQFSQVLNESLEAQDGIRFSNHAMQRLRERNISLSPGQLGAIRDAVDQAAARGGRESLLLMEDLALVASVPNRTVITAMRTDETSSNVFTNIDSAVVVAPVAPSHNKPTGAGPDSL